MPLAMSSTSRACWQTSSGCACLPCSRWNRSPHGTNSMTRRSGGATPYMHTRKGLLRLLMMVASLRISLNAAMTSPEVALACSFTATCMPFHLHFLTIPNAPFPTTSPSSMSSGLIWGKYDRATSGARRDICTHRDGITMSSQYANGLPCALSATSVSYLNSHGWAVPPRRRQCAHGTMRSTAICFASLFSTDSSTFSSSRKCLDLVVCDNFSLTVISRFL
mmetsp:Transcript_3785/g.9233  ORF Transcript_3785/g.9233 Transcript_3785/m.9233 type:complete len:221 (+) Transcript_3785:554-1216(+)